MGASVGALRKKRGKRGSHSVPCSSACGARGSTSCASLNLVAYDDGVVGEHYRWWSKGSVLERWRKGVRRQIDYEMKKGLGLEQRKPPADWGTTHRFAFLALVDRLPRLA